MVLLLQIGAGWLAVAFPALAFSAALCRAGRAEDLALGYAEPDHQRDQG